MGRRTAATGGWLSPGRACPAGCTPHFLFGLGRKENGPYPQGVCRIRKRQSRQRLRDCTVQKKRPLLVATLHVRAKLLYGGRRIGACSDLGLPSGTLGPSARSVLPSRGGLCGGQRGARTHLTSFSFRAFCLATRCPGGRRSGCLAYVATFINNRPAAAKREAGFIRDLPGPKVSPRAGRFRP